MFYPESETYVTRFPNIADTIRRIDHFLAERNTKAFFASQASGLLNINMTEVQRVLELYANDSVVSKQTVWLCPQDGKELQFGYETVIFCPTCEEYYAPEQCEERTLYEPFDSPLRKTFHDQALLSASRWVRLDKWLVIICLVLLGVLGSIELENQLLKLLSLALGLVPSFIGALDATNDIPILRGLLSRRQSYLAKVGFERAIAKHAEGRNSPHS